MTVHALFPPVIESFHYYPFEGCYDKASLHVPAEALAYYQENPFWSRFTRIETFDPEAIHSVEAEAADAQELWRQFGQGTQRTPPAPLRLLGQQAFNENPEGVASSQPRASERSERHPGLGRMGSDTPRRGKSNNRWVLSWLLPLRGFTLFACLPCTHEIYFPSATPAEDNLAWPHISLASRMTRSVEASELNTEYQPWGSWGGSQR